MTTTAQIAVLLTATVLTGLVAGLLAAFAHTVMPGLAAADDRGFLRGFQAVDRAVTNPWFLVCFAGGPVLVLVSVLLTLDDPPTRPWSLLALVLSVVTLAVTRVVHLPLNGAVQAMDLSTAPDEEVTALRVRFEARWRRWNVVRTVSAVGSFACLAAALTRLP